MNRYKRIEQRILKTVDAIRRGSNSLYDVAQDCLALLGDSDAYAAAIGIEADQVPEHIESRFLADFNIRLSELAVINKVFPDRAQWDKPLAAMYDAASEAVTSARAQNQQHAPKRRAATLKDLEDAEDRAKDAEAQLVRTRSEIDQLRAENSDLRRENLMLKGRIEELERLLSRRGEAAYAG